jgi:multiple sugar transport system substrate-binding protein
MTATGMVMANVTQVPDAAWKVFEWYNGREPAVDRAKSGWGVPALKSMYDLMPTQTPFQQQAQRVLREEFKYTEFTLQFNPYIGASTVFDSWAKNLDQALRDQITFDQLLENVEAEVNTAIKEGIERMG